MQLPQDPKTSLAQMLDHEDLFLFSRRVLDFIADTDDMALYQKGIDYTNDFTHAESDKPLQLQLSQQLWAQLSHINNEKPAQNHQPILVAEHITKSYGYNKFNFGPVSLSIVKGQVYGLVGENGNGKTTLLRILAKELLQDKGNITYHLQRNNPKNLYDLRTRLIYIPQRTQKWYGSLMDNLKFALSNYNTPPHEINPRVLLMIARLGLWKYKDLQWDELSSGYKMRFELARTLLRKPEIMFLDEPLANLDILSQQIILEDLKSICTSEKYPIALILSSQQLYEVEKVSEKIIFLKNGQYKENDNTQEAQENRTLVVELDSTATREELQLAFQHLEVLQIQNNGGHYLIHFNSQWSFHDVLSAIAEYKIPILYIRNITTSTRRYFAV